MARKMSGASVLVLGMMLCFSACGGLQQPVVVDAKLSHVVEVKVSDFAFEPNNLQVHEGDTIDFKLQNVSSRDHNFTLEDPDGKTLQDVAIPAGKTVDVKVSFLGTGTYRFHCSIDLHSAMGMKGQVVVSK